MGGGSCGADAPRCGRGRGGAGRPPSPARDRRRPGRGGGRGGPATGLSCPRTAAQGREQPPTGGRPAPAGRAKEAGSRSPGALRRARSPVASGVPSVARRQLCEGGRSRRLQNRWGAESLTFFQGKSLVVSTVRAAERVLLTKSWPSDLRGLRLPCHLRGPIQTCSARREQNLGKPGEFSV
ncbi:uncharacterized protein LOC144584092 [Pogona vitticeps]